MDREILSGILYFVQSRCKEEGGYGATPLLPATVEDTYHALCTIEILGKIRSLGNVLAFSRHKGSLRRYLTSVADTPWLSARTTFQVLHCASLAGLALHSGKTKDYIRLKLMKPTGLAERYFCARILREVLAVHDMTVWSKARMVRFVKWRTARELWMKLYLQQSVSPIESTRKEKIIHWLQACQNGDGGFGFLPGTTSYIENCHTCTRALALLHGKPLNVEGCHCFVLACRTGSGGFARSPGSASFLDATWHAVAVLSVLEIL
jgi:hypothetical protein